MMAMAEISIPNVSIGIEEEKACFRMGEQGRSGKKIVHSLCVTKTGDDRIFSPRASLFVLPPSSLLILRSLKRRPPSRRDRPAGSRI